MNEEFGRKRRNKKGKLSTAAKVIIAVVLVIYAIVMFAIGFIVFYKPSVRREVPFNPTVTDAEGKTHEVSFEPKGDSYNFLVLGRDRMAFLTDVMMIINVDTANNSMAVMQLPRDTYISGGYPTSKLNAVFSTYYSKYLNNFGTDTQEAEKYALGEFKTLLSQSLCININYAAILNLEGFKNIVDILGGVDINVQNGMFYSDPYQGLYIDIPAGWQHLNGEQAEGFVRFRSGYATADLGREDAQKQFLFALFSKIKSTISITEIPRLTQLANEVYANLVTDISAADTVFFAKCLIGIDTSSIKMFTIPGNMSDGWCVINKRAAVERIFNHFYTDIHSETSDKFNGEAGLFEVFDRNRIFDNGYGVYDAYEYLYGDEYGSGDEINIPRNGY
ncbi:MAG: LCP family protein [Clostridia bacterium]|nr:LCP family protein [Clostridia bacterium]